MFGPPEVDELSNGIRLFWLPTDKFKTVTFKLYLHQELKKDFATKTALLPAVLERGTNLHPDRISLRRELDNLYGAELSADVEKRGERHIMEVSLEMVHPRYLGGFELLGKGLAMMRDLVADPFLENGGFCRSYIDQEKYQLAREIKSLLNDKVSYALERCIAEMCRDEPYGIYKLGNLKDLEKIDPRDLYLYSRELINQNPMDFYIVGLQRQEEIESLLRDIFTFERKLPLKELPPMNVYREKESETVTLEETMPVSQSKLVLGYRTNVPYNHELYYPLVMCNGVLGGFPHSKLFQNVREKASLAYFVFSRLEIHKGLMFIAAGIDPAHYHRVLEIIAEQLDKIVKGDITREELENTRTGLINQLRSRVDNPDSLINFFLNAEIGGKKHGFAGAIERIQKITVEEVMEAADRISLDTVFFLRGEEGRSII